MSLAQFGTLLLLASLWGASFLFMRVSSPVIGPVLLIELRVFIAALVLLIYTVSIARIPNLRSKWKQYLTLGAINAAIPFTLIATSEIYLDASTAAILNSTTPLFTSLVAVFWLKESFSFRKGLGFILGITGVAVLVGWSPLVINTQIIFSIVASLLAAFSYGIGAIYAKVTFSGTSSMDLALGQQLGAGFVLFPFAVYPLPQFFPSMTVTACVLALAIASTAFAYLFYFYLIESVGPTKTSCVTMLVPVFGIIWGTIFLGEKPHWSTGLGLIMVLLSITTVTELRWKSAPKKVSVPPEAMKNLRV